MRVLSGRTVLVRLRGALKSSKNLIKVTAGVSMVFFGPRSPFRSGFSGPVTLFANLSPNILSRLLHASSHFSVFSMGLHPAKPLFFVLLFSSLDGEVDPTTQVSTEASFEDGRKNKDAIDVRMLFPPAPTPMCDVLESALFRESQAPARPRRSALPYPPTVDLEPDWCAQRVHDMQLHHVRQTEYRSLLHARPS